MQNTSPFKPAWWLRHRHAQTIWPNLFRRACTIKTRRERLDLPDGDFIDLDWTTGDTGPIVVILHGLGGSIESAYAKGLLAKFHTKGWRGVLMHFRGASEEPNRLPRSYYAGEYQDTAFFIDTLRTREAHTPIAVVGISIGGSALINLLAKKPDLPISAAIAVSIPFDLHDAARELDSGFSRVYQHHILRTLHKKTRQKFTTISAPFDIAKIHTLRNFRQFDDVITAPVHGFKNANEYYDRCSPRQYLRDIRHPTLIIHAADDPFMTPACIPAQNEVSRVVELEVYPKGGHVGFVSGKFPWKPHYWLESRIPEFLATYLKTKTNNESA